jgi:hypothetical protein
VLVATDLGLSGSSAITLGLVAAFAVLATGLALSQITVPAFNWHYYRKDPQVAWWRDRGWEFLFKGSDSR